METRHKILMLDDDPEVLNMYQEMLEQLPSRPEIRTASSGTRAMAMLEAEDFRLLICDLKMPKLLGDEFYLKAKELRPSLGDRFIFVTGFAADPNIALFFNRHEVKYLVKPFSIQVLIDCVKQLLC